MSKQAVRITAVCATFLLIRSIPLPLPYPFGDGLSLLLAAILSLTIPAMLSRGEEVCATSTRNDRSLSSALPYLLLAPPFALFTLGIGQLCGWLGDVLGLAGPSYPSALLPMLLTGCILAPVAEEVTFRLGVQRPLEEQDAAGAVLVGAILFALMHTNAVQIPYALVAGIVLGAVAVASGSLLAPIFLHGLSNVLSLCLLCFPQRTGLILLLFGIGSLPAALWLLFSKDPRRALLSALRPTDQTLPTLRELLRSPCSFLLAGLILFTVLRHLRA